MINPDDQPKDTASAETDDDEQAASQRREATTAEIDSDKRAASHPTSTAEVAKDLDRRKGREPSDAAATVQIFRHLDRKSTRLNSSHRTISYAVFCLKKKKTKKITYNISYT